MNKPQPYWQTLPDGFAVLPIPDQGKTYVTYKGRMVVTKETGSPKFFKGTDEVARVKAYKWVWSFCDGNQEKYRVE